MEEITQIPFWLVYLASHVGGFFFLCTLLIGVLMFVLGLIACAIIFNDRGDVDERKFARRILFSYWFTFPLFIVFGILAAITPSEKDFRTYIVVKCCNEALHSDIGKASQEAITGWLTKQVEENYKDVTR